MNDLKDLNQGADFWRGLGLNVFPSDSQNKRTYERWKENGWQNHPISSEQHEKWKKEGAFDKGFMVMPGTPWHRSDKIKLYLVCIEWDRAAEDSMSSLRVNRWIRFGMSILLNNI